ncbi:AAA family ATPase [Cellulomonas fimi]|uniref:AAA family ATPase n=1 Tax=Cellulomonas fimi TaxID=1708 RepID=UPI00234C6139|nr:AAA family ATPase [Cellulomonas fimi]MDC7123057.1 AAA family ATPase [Cellulomonas fimi]
MQLRTLTVQALGPFAGRHTVDFAALAASGLFLLDGPTGSGKSTLIDAVVFALYGKVASADASDDRLRSAYAADDVPTVVDLTFEVASGVYRVRRSPGYDRPKKRGTGTVRQQPSITLWRLSPDDHGSGDVDDVPAGEVLSTRLDEAGAELQRVVGLDRTQFVQTIVLPQGEFARFLRADPEQRRGLLQKIFGTEVYDRIGRRLVELKRESADAVATARTSLTTAAAHLVGAARLDEDAAAVLRVDLDEAVASGTVDAVDAVVGALTATVTEAAAAAEARAAAAEQRRSEARTVLDEATRTADLLRRRDALLAERAALDEAEPVHGAAVARLGTARAAQAVRPLLRRSDEARAALESASKALDAAVDVAPADLADLARRSAPDGAVSGDESSGGEPAPGARSGRGLEPGGTRGLRGPRGGLPDGRSAAGAGGAADRGAGALHPTLFDDLVVEDVPSRDGRRRLDVAREESVAQAAAVERLVAVEAGLEGRRIEVRAARATVDDLRAEIAAHDTWLAGRPDERAVLVAAHREAADLAAGVPERTAAVDALTEVATALVALDDASDRHAAAERRLATAARAAASAVKAEAALRTARIADLAGELASALADGDACPVCGAVEHPAKAALGSDHVTADTVQEAEDARVAAEHDVRAAEGDVVRCAEQVAALTRQVDGATARDVATRLAAAHEQLAAARDAVAEATRLARDLETHDAATARRAAQRQEAVTGLAAAEVRIEALVQQLDAAEAEVVAGRGEHPTVAARHAALRGRAAAAATLADALLAVERAHADDTVRRGELADGLAEHGFADAAEARDALVDPAVLAELTTTVEAYVAAVARVRAGLADEAIAALPDDLVVDLAAAREAERLARVEHEAAAGESRSARDRARAVAAATAAVVEASRVLVERTLAHAPVARLAAVAGGTGGDNAHALSLATYVLTRRFEDVVAAANDRLLGMSDGRYELVRSDVKEDVSTRRTGLAMRVVDHRTGHQRDPRTLSGGETFYVSLCLALGLADVVSAEAGGIDLGTLFVDEGFGTLDPHTLDQVLAELGRLRAGGRVVGVVSHVETLKQAIADRIEVRPTTHGPSTLTVRAG